MLWIWTANGDVRRRDPAGTWTQHAVRGTIDDALVAGDALYVLQGHGMTRIGAQQTELAPVEGHPHRLLLRGSTVVGIDVEGVVRVPGTFRPHHQDVLATADRIEQAWLVGGDRLAWTATVQPGTTLLMVQDAQGFRPRLRLPSDPVAIDRWAGTGAVLQRSGSSGRVATFDLFADDAPTLRPGVLEDVRQVLVDSDVVFVAHAGGLSWIPAQGPTQTVGASGTLIAADAEQAWWHDPEGGIWRRPLTPDSTPVRVAEGEAFGDGRVLVFVPGDPPQFVSFAMDGDDRQDHEPAEIWDVVGAQVHRGVPEGDGYRMRSVDGSDLGLLVAPEGMRFDDNVTDGQRALFWRGPTLIQATYRRD